MAQIKLSLNPNPTFKAEVGIPVPGDNPVKVEFVFKHHTKDEIKAWLADKGEETDPEAIMFCVAGWALDDKFSIENVKRLDQSYAGAAGEIIRTYLSELRGARTKN